MKCKTSNEKCDGFREQINHLQTELVKTKQELGEALNSAYDYER